MKKSLLFVAMLLACFGVAKAGIEITSVNVDQPANDTLLFALPVTPGCSQEIWTTYTNPETGQAYRPTMYQPEYLVTAQDFTCGDTEKGTATLPNNAKVIGLGLDGFLQSCEDLDYCAQSVTAWCRNVPRTKLTLDFLDLFDGYKTHKPQGDLFTDTVTYRGFNGKPGYYCPIDVNSNAENLCSVVEIPFGNPDDPNMPFWYKGENIYLTLWLVNHYKGTWDGGTHIEYHYMAFDNAEVEFASLMRSGNICFNSETQDLVQYVPGWVGTELMYELPAHRLPAFRTPYFTNDVRITFIGSEAEMELKDADGNIIERAADGNYYSLDHTMTYTLTADGEEDIEITFEDIYKDVDVVVRKEVTAINEISGTKTVANVAYYNLAGQQCAQPVNGVNIVVTTYTDGSTTTSKVIK
ncbi:MAG: hypothetical protein IKX56_00585 [Muribaculaceae bacterium]|nr:hypothetical protein [Muribaculaceae bacterium]